MMRHSRGLDCGFTLIEVIGVLAVIAVLAALLIPKIFESINSARLNQAVLSCQTIKTAVLEHYGKFHSLNSSNGISFPVSGTFANYDSILLAEGMIDKPFSPTIAASSILQLVSIPSAAGGPITGAYDLDGNGSGDVAGGQFVVEALLVNVSLSDARALNNILDGPTLGEDTNGNDFAGRVIYAKPGSNPLILHIYITHH